MNHKAFRQVNQTGSRACSGQRAERRPNRGVRQGAGLLRTDGGSGARLQALGGTGKGERKEPMPAEAERLSTPETPERGQVPENTQKPVGRCGSDGDLKRPESDFCSPEHGAKTRRSAPHPGGREGPGAGHSAERPSCIQRFPVKEAHRGREPGGRAPEKDA